MVCSICDLCMSCVILSFSHVVIDNKPHVAVSCCGYEERGKLENKMSI